MPRRAAAVVVAIVLAGCAADPGVAAPDGSSSATTATTATTGTEPASPLLDTMAPLDRDTGPWDARQQAAIEAYVRAEQAYHRARAAPTDPEPPALAATHVDPLLGARRAQLAELQRNGQAYRLPSVFAVRPTCFGRTDDTEALLASCTTVDLHHVGATGETLDQATGTLLVLSLMRHTPDGWRLADRRIDPAGLC